MKPFIFAAFFISQAAFALTCSSKTGTVTFNGKDVETGVVLTGKGDVVTAANSNVVLLLSESEGDRSEIRLGPDSRLTIDDKLPFNPLLASGNARARLKEKVSKRKFTLRTPASVMAVRGTDFMTVYGPMLGESEIVVFDGAVRFSSASNAKDFREIQKGYWGGIGGRYGKKIGELIRLPSNVLSHFDQSSQF